MLALPICQDARLVLPDMDGARSGGADLSRQVELAHVIDVPEAERWVGAHTLVLTTGLSWPRGGAALREVGERLARKQPAAVMLAVPGPFCAFPAEVARALSAAGIPALTLPYEVPFVQVVQAVQQERVREQSALLLRSEAIHRALTQAALNGGLNDVVQTLAHHLGRPVAMVDANGELLKTEDSGGLPLAGAGPPPAATTRRMLERPGSAPRRVSGKGSGAGGLLAPVILSGQRVAGLWIAAEAGREVHTDGTARLPTARLPTARLLDDRAVMSALPVDFNASDPQAADLQADDFQAADSQASDFAADLERRSIEHACTVAALLLLAQRELEAREQQLGYAFVDTLLEGRFVPEPLSLERARRLGFDDQGTYTVGLLSLSGPLPLSLDGVTRRERLAGQVRDTLLALGSVSPGATSSGAAKPVALLSVGLNQVCFLLPHSGPGTQVGSGIQSGKLTSVHPAAPPRSLPPQRFWALLGPELRADVGLVYSRPRQGAQGVALSRAEVLALAPHTVIGESRGFAELLLPRALSGDAAAQQQLIAATLGPLQTARGGENLIATLRTLSACGWAQERAAALLGVHPNTLRYRMGRAEQLTSRALADPEVRSLWWLVFQLERLQGPEAGPH